MFTCRAIAAIYRHPRGEPRSPSPPNPSRTAAPIRFLATGQPTHSDRPLTSATPFPSRSPLIARGDVGDLSGLGDLDARPASPHAPARFVTTCGWQVVAPRVVPMNRRDPSASLQTHRRQQLPLCVAKNEFRDTLPVATEFAPSSPPTGVSQKPTPPMSANKTSWLTWPTRLTSKNQPFFILANPLDTKKHPKNPSRPLPTDHCPLTTDHCPLTSDHCPLTSDL